MSYTDQEYDATRTRSIASFDQPGRSSQEGSFSVIDQFSRFDGTFVAERDLRIEGDMKGTIECRGTLFLAQGATVSARVEAENVTIAGELAGEINCRGRLQLLPSGRLKGKVRTRGLVVAEGATYDGELVMDASGARSGSANGQPGESPQTPLEPGAVRLSDSARRGGSRSSSATRAAQSSAGGDDTPAPSTFIRRLGGQETPWEGAPENAPAEADNAES